MPSATLANGAAHGLPKKDGSAEFDQEGAKVRRRRRVVDGEVEELPQVNPSSLLRASPAGEMQGLGEVRADLSPMVKMPQGLPVAFHPIGWTRAQDALPFRQVPGPVLGEAPLEAATLLSPTTARRSL